MNKRTVIRRWILLLVLTLSPEETRLGKAEEPATVLRIWGLRVDETGRSPLLDVLTQLETGYRQTHPEVAFVHHLKGNDSALGGLYVGAADLVLMDREPSSIELDAYQQAIPGLTPFRMPLMRGNTRAVGHSSPLVVVVNRRNPIMQLTMTELNALFNAKPEAPVRRPRTWHDLGLIKVWSDRPINLYGFPVDSEEAQTFSRLVMSGSQRWVCKYQERKHKNNSLRIAKDIVEAVGKDRYAIGLTTFDAVSSETKVVAIGNPGEAALPTPETLSSGRYSLGRTVLVLARADKSGHMEDQVRSFLEYLMSAKAQAIITVDGFYIPLTGTGEILR